MGHSKNPEIRFMGDFRGSKDGGRSDKKKKTIGKKRKTAFQSLILGQSQQT